MATITSQNSSSSKKETDSSFLTAEELKAKLFDRFQKKGVLNGLRAQLRNQLAQELSKPHPHELTTPDQKPADKDPIKIKNLPLLISTWLVQDYLQRRNYHYTLSTLMTESRQLSITYEDFTIYDILYILGVGQESIQFKIITEKYFMSELDFLYAFLTTCLKYCKYNVYSIGTQTENELNSNKRVMNISNDIHALNHLPSTQSLGLPMSANRYLSSSLDLDSKPVNQESIEAKYEKNSFHFERKQIEKQEKDILGVRWKLLKDMDDFFEHEKTVRYELDQRKNALNLKEECLQMQRKELEKKEQELNKRTSNLNSIMEDRFSSFEQQQSLKYDEKLLQLKKREDNLKNEEERYREGKKLLEEYIAELNTCKSALKELEIENTNLHNQLESVADYSEIKNSLICTTAELEKAKTLLKQAKDDYENEKKLLEGRLQETQLGLAKSQSELLDKLHQLQDNYKLDGAVLQQKQQRLEQELQETKQLYNSVLMRSENQQMDIQESHKIIQQLQNMLEYKLSTHSKNIHSDFPFRSPLIHYWNTDTSKGSIFNSFLHVNKEPANVTLDIPNVYREVNIIEKDSQKFILEAKQRINYLQEEADALQSRYHEYLKSWSNVKSEKITHPITVNSSMQRLVENVHSHVEYKNVTNSSHLLHQVKGAELNLSYSPFYYKSSQKLSSQNIMPYHYKPFLENDTLNSGVHIHNDASNQNGLSLNSDSLPGNLMVGKDLLGGNPEMALENTNVSVDCEKTSSKVHVIDLDAAWKEYSSENKQFPMKSKDNFQSLNIRSKAQVLQPPDVRNDTPQLTDSSTVFALHDDKNRVLESSRKKNLPSLHTSVLNDQQNTKFTKKLHGERFNMHSPSSSIVIPTLPKSINPGQQEEVYQKEIVSNASDSGASEILPQKNSFGESTPQYPGGNEIVPEGESSSKDCLQNKTNSIIISKVLPHISTPEINKNYAAYELSQKGNLAMKSHQNSSSNSKLAPEESLNEANKLSEHHHQKESYNMSDHTIVDSSTSSEGLSAKNESFHADNEVYSNDKTGPFHSVPDVDNVVGDLEVVKSANNYLEKYLERVSFENDTSKGDKQVCIANQADVEITSQPTVHSKYANTLQHEHSVASQEAKESSDETLSELHISGCSDAGDNDDSGW